MNLLITFINRLCDTIFNTSKTMFIQRNKFVLAGLCVFASDIFYFSVTKMVVSSDIKTMIAAASAGAIGCSFAVLVGDKLSKDKLYINTITSYNDAVIDDIDRYLTNKNIQHIVCDTYEMHYQTKTIIAYAETKYESKLIDNYLNSSIYSKDIKRIVKT